MRRFYAPVESFSECSVELDFEQSRHLRTVLRLKDDDRIRVFDGAGKEFECRIKSIGSGKTCCGLEIISEVEPPIAEPEIHLTLAVALLKSDKFDLVLQKAVELGAAEIIPIITKRCDVRPKSSTQKIGRFERIIIEASKQCGRANLLKLSEAISFEAFAKPTSGTRLLFSEKNGKSFSTINPDKKITAVIGPEGGWEDSEIDHAVQNGFQIITLGGRILRAETAAISITGLLQHRFGDLN